MDASGGRNFEKKRDHMKRKRMLGLMGAPKGGRGGGGEMATVHSETDLSTS